MQLNPKGIYLIAGVTDLRCGIDGYAHIVQDRYSRSPMDGSLYIFCNRNHNKLKMLFRK